MRYHGPMVHRNTAPSEQVVSARATLQRRVRAIERALARIEILLELADTLAGRHARHSDRGWMVSMLTLEAGTLMAVSSGGKARGWSSVCRALELERLRLQIDRASAERELAGL